MNYPDLPQYILWKEEPRSGGKPTKVPCDINGKNINPHDPRYWMTYNHALQLANQRGFGVGFVLTKDDQFFCLDLDKCRDPLTGLLDERAVKWQERLPGCLTEISVSGTGIHIWGRTDSEITDTFMIRTGEYELYTHKRFIALGTHMTGSVDDPQAVVKKEQWEAWLTPRIKKHQSNGFSKASIADHQPYTNEGSPGLPETGPVPEYAGPQDDQQLIQMAMQAHPSADVAFGQKASFRDLWTCNVEVLAKMFPAVGDDDFDRSAADAALCARLAFWTGKDAARMKRPWLKSPVAASRPDQKKLQRADYLNGTIQYACQHCDIVYTGNAASNSKDLIAERLADRDTHHDMALAFVHSVCGKLLFNTDSGVWYEYDGTRWKNLQPGAVSHQIRLFCDRNTRADLKRTRSYNFISSVEKLVMADPAIAKQAAELDIDNYLLNTPSGTLNLLTSKMGLHDSNDLITKITAVSPTNETSPVWRGFLDDVCCGDVDLAKTLQMLLGSSLSGANEDHWFGFCYGPGRNGKNTLFDTVAYVFGDYAMSAPSSLFVAKKHEDHKEGLARLRVPGSSCHPKSTQARTLLRRR